MAYLAVSGRVFVSGNFLLILDLKVMQSIQMLLSAGEGGFEKRPQYAQRNPVPQGAQVGWEFWNQDWLYQEQQVFLRISIRLVIDTVFFGLQLEAFIS